MLEVQITDGGGTGKRALVRDQTIVFSQYGSPPLLPQKSRVFRTYLETTAGSNDMGIDGSTNPVKFYVAANFDDDRYVTIVNFIVGYSSSAALYEFSDSGGALANGFRFYYEGTDGEVDIHDAIKTNSDLLRMGVPGVFPTSWEVRNLGGVNDYGYIVSINLLDMIPPYGLKLDRGTSQRLVFQVRDDNTDADTMNAQVYGFERFE